RAHPFISAKLGASGEAHLAQRGSTPTTETAGLLEARPFAAGAGIGVSQAATITPTAQTPAQTPDMDPSRGRAPTNRRTRCSRLDLRSANAITDAARGTARS